jgi:hypothetical protein
MAQSRDLQDAHLAVPAVDDTWACYAVFDGHGGPEVSAYVARHFVQALRASSEYKNDQITAALQATFLKLDLDVKADEALEELKQLAGIAEGWYPFARLARLAKSVICEQMPTKMAIYQVLKRVMMLTSSRCYKKKPLWTLM